MCKLFSVLTAAALCAALLAGCGDAGDTGRDTAANGAAAATPGTAADDSTMAGEPSPTPSAGDRNASGDGSGADGGDTGVDEGTPDTAASAEATGAAYSAEGLDKALGGILAVEGGSAGGTLQTAQAAGALVEFAAQCGTDSATLGADTKAWLDSLSEADRTALKENWAAVCERARGISGDYDSNKGILADAGVATDFSALDMSGVDAFLNTVDSVLGV